MRLLILCSLLTLGLVWPASDIQLPFIPVQPDGTTVAPSPGPRHIEWVSWPVGNLVLINPTVLDSTGRARMLVIPPNSILSIPIWVAGRDPAGT